MTTQELLADLLHTIAPSVGSGSVATGPAPDALGRAWFDGHSALRPDVYDISKLFSPRYEQVWSTFITRSVALGGRIVVPVIAIPETGHYISIDYIGDSTGSEDPFYACGKWPGLPPDAPWRDISRFDAEVPNEYRIPSPAPGAGRLLHRVTEPSSDYFGDPLVLADVTKRWQFVRRRNGLPY